MIITQARERPYTVYYAPSLQMIDLIAALKKGKKIKEIVSSDGLLWQFFYNCVTPTEVVLFNSSCMEPTSRSYAHLCARKSYFIALHHWGAALIWRTHSIYEEHVIYHLCCISRACEVQHLLALYEELHQGVAKLCKDKNNQFQDRFKVENIWLQIFLRWIRLC